MKPHMLALALILLMGSMTATIAQSAGGARGGGAAFGVTGNMGGAISGTSRSGISGAINGEINGEINGGISGTDNPSRDLRPCGTTLQGSPPCTPGRGLATSRRTGQNIGAGPNR
jgi:hypothetical protein